MKSLITHSPRCEQKRLTAINTARTEEHAQLDKQTRHTSLHDGTHTHIALRVNEEPRQLRDTAQLYTATAAGSVQCTQRDALENLYV